MEVTGVGESFARRMMAVDYSIEGGGVVVNRSYFGDP